MKVRTLPPPAVGKHAQEDDDVREGCGAGPTAWFRPAGGGHRQRDADSWRTLADARELYASAEAQASAITKQEEELVACARQVNQREQEVEKLDGLLQKQEELDDITLRRKLEVLSTHDLEREQKAMEDVCAQILARELNVDARDTELRDQEAQLVAWERQLVERRMQELVVAQEGLEHLWAS
jgi:hypothetical protein